MRRIALGLVAVAAAVSIGFGIAALTGSFPAQAAANVVYVNDNALPDVAGCNAADASTIAGGITAADPGDTVVLCEGTYAGATVGKSVTIEGRAEADRADIVVEGASDGLTVNAANVTIQHLKLDGPSADTGILLSAAADDSVLRDLEITDWDNGIGTPDPGPDGVLVEDSYLHDNNSNAVGFFTGAGNVVRNNRIEDNAPGYGILFREQDKSVIEGNTLSGNDDEIGILDRTVAYVYRNTITPGVGNGVLVKFTVAESLVIIGGSAENANSFSGTLGADKYYVRLNCGSENTVDATWNDWGSTNRTAIAALIFNDEDDPDAAAPDCPADVDGAVVFHPWATGPAPTATPTPTPTPSPKIGRAACRERV